MRRLLLLALGAASLAADPAPLSSKRRWDDPFPGVVQDSVSIKGFVGDYRWLSNFYPCPVTIQGAHFASSEAAYQASKFPRAEWEAFAHLDPDGAKRLAHSRKLDEASWDRRKDQAMLEVVWAKFSQNPDLAAKLLSTGDRLLEETNWWGDTYWGVCNGKGENVFGKTLTEVRRRLRAAAAPRP